MTSTVCSRRAAHLECSITQPPFHAEAGLSDGRFFRGKRELQSVTSVGCRVSHIHVVSRPRLSSSGLFYIRAGSSAYIFVLSRVHAPNYDLTTQRTFKAPG